MSDWLQLQIITREPSRIEDELLALGAEAITLGDAADCPVLEPAPGETPLWPELRVTGLFPGDADGEALRTALAASGACRADEIRLEPLADRAWEREWLADFAPMRFGERLWVSPHETDWRAPDDAVVLRMDPGLAFGTGTHATTRLCLEWLDAAPLAGARVIDVGCGSGVLAVAAALLGAREVVALDIDPQALTATRENAGRNGVAGRLTVAPADALAQLTPADVVIANILAGTLIELTEALSRLVRPGGALVLSGILAEQAAAVRAAYAADFIFVAKNSATWIRLDGRRFATRA